MWQIDQTLSLLQLVFERRRINGLYSTSHNMIRYLACITYHECVVKQRFAAGAGGKVRRTCVKLLCHTLHKQVLPRTHVESTGLNA